MADVNLNVDGKKIANWLVYAALILAGATVAARYLATGVPSILEPITPFSDLIITIGGGIGGWMIAKRNKLF